MFLLQRLADMGYSISLRGDDLKLTWTGEGKPDPDQVKPLFAELKERKQEALTYLRSQQQSRQAQVLDFQAEAVKVKDYLRQHGIAKIRSDTLKEDVFFATDETQAGKAPKGAVIYTLDELRELARGNLTGEDLKQIHAVKKIFNGRVVQNSKNPFGSL